MTSPALLITDGPAPRPALGSGWLALALVRSP